MISSTTVSIIAAVSSSIVAVVLAVVNVYERYWRERQETLIRALEYLTGGSQKRSVGIALIEGLLHRGHPNHRAIIPALTNQAIYLLLETESTGRHQFHNWLRIMGLILRVPADRGFHDLYIELIEALDARSEDDGGDLAGLNVSPGTARRWAEKIRKHSGIS